MKLFIRKRNNQESPNVEPTETIAIEGLDENGRLRKGYKRVKGVGVVRANNWSKYYSE